MFSQIVVGLARPPWADWHESRARQAWRFALSSRLPHDQDIVVEPGELNRQTRRDKASRVCLSVQLPPWRS